MKSILYLFSFLLLGLNCARPTKQEGQIMTVNGFLSTQQMGQCLIHEHVLVDFIGADSTHEGRWNKAEVVQRVLPFLKELKALGIETIMECTPAYIGRDPVLLQVLADSTGLNILTNTGLYGAVNNKFLPEYAYTETATQLAHRWINEWEKGINGTGIKPGFIKIGVNPDSLSELHQKLVRAAAITHLATGLTIAAHTGLALPAFQEIQILRDEGVAPNAFIWVHAQNEKDSMAHIRAARAGAWISLDGISDKNVAQYVMMINTLRAEGLLNRVLLSHDAGWYSPGEPNGGGFRPYTSLHEKLIPALKDSGYSPSEIDQLLVLNPREGFAIGVREINPG